MRRNVIVTVLKSGKIRVRWMTNNGYLDTRYYPTWSKVMMFLQHFSHDHIRIRGVQP